MTPVPKNPLFPAVKRRKLEATFSGGEISSDGGVVLLREADRHLGLLEAEPGTARPTGFRQGGALPAEPVAPAGLWIVSGYEDLNDHQELRRDPAIQTAVERNEVLASQATLCGWNNAWAARQRWPCTGCW